MNLWKSTEKKLTSKEILDHASKCKPEKLENLLNQIQTITEQSNNKQVDHDLLRAKTIITSRLASREIKFLIIIIW